MKTSHHQLRSLLSTRCGALWAALSALFLGLFCYPPLSQAKDLALWECPEVVAHTIIENLQGGKLNVIKCIEIQNKALYLVKINAKAFRATKLHIDDTGKLLKTIEKMRVIDLPEPVRESVKILSTSRGRIVKVEKVTIDEVVEYHVEINRPQMRNLELAFDEQGGLAEQK